MDRPRMPTTATPDLRALLRDFRLNVRPPYAWDDEDTVLIRTVVAGLQAQAARERDPSRYQAWLVDEVARHYHLLWTVPLGYDRSYTLFVRSDDPRFSGIEKVSELKDHIGDPH